MFNFIDCVRLCVSDTGKYRVIAEHGDDRHKFDFSNRNIANLFTAYCVYPFIHHDTGDFQNMTTMSAQYFFDADVHENIGGGQGFFDYGDARSLRSQRRKMTLGLIKNLFGIKAR